MTDESWQVRDSAIRFQNNYLGEWHDARTKSSGAPRAVALATEPVGPLIAEPQPPIRVREKLKPISVTERAPGVWIFDFGVNGAGQVRAIFKGTSPGQTIVLRYGELLHKDGSLNPMTGVCGQIKGGSKERHGAPKKASGPKFRPFSRMFMSVRDALTRSFPRRSGFAAFAMSRCAARPVAPIFLPSI